MITSEIMLQRAEKLGLSAVDADVETEFDKRTKAPHQGGVSNGSLPNAT